MAPKNISRRHSSLKKGTQPIKCKTFVASQQQQLLASLFLSFLTPLSPLFFHLRGKWFFATALVPSDVLFRDIEKEAQYAAFAATKKYHRHRGDVDLFAVHRRNKQPPSLAASRPTPPENAAFDVRWCVLVCRSSVDSEKKRQRFIQLEKASKSTTLGDC